MLYNYSVVFMETLHNRHSTVTTAVLRLNSGRRCRTAAAVSEYKIFSLFQRLKHVSALQLEENLVQLQVLLLYLFGVGKLPEQWRERGPKNHGIEQRHKEEADTQMMKMMTIVQHAVFPPLYYLFSSVFNPKETSYKVWLIGFLA